MARSQNAKKLMVSDHFWKLEVQKVAGCCGAKHTFSNTEGFGRLFDVRRWKSGTPLWREAHFQPKTHKTFGGVGATAQKNACNGMACDTFHVTCETLVP